MNNKGFAITGIIYTLFILFLMILLATLSGINSFQRMMINSIEPLTNTFEGRKIEENELEKIKTNNLAYYTGKYIFKQIEGNLECYAYLNKGVELDLHKITLSPSNCTINNNSLELVGVYSFEGES